MAGKQSGPSHAAPSRRGGRALCASRKRKGLTTNPSNASEQEDSGNESLPGPNKKQKISPDGPLVTSSSAGGGSSSTSSGSHGTTEPMDVDIADYLYRPDDVTSSESLEYCNGALDSENGICNDLRPISDVNEMHQDIVKRLCPIGLKERPVKLNVATLCSGTDAPIFALRMLQNAMQTMGFGSGYEFKHLYSCEIEPFKQGFIRRNVPGPPLIFRDGVEMVTSDGKATTAGGSKIEIPREPLDIIFAGCSCVDYSNMNTSKRNESLSSLDKHLKSAASGDASPVALDQTFLGDLDKAVDKLVEKGIGESTRTFFAALKLITMVRPKTIILENVSGAPWDMYTKRIFPKIGYVARCVRLDTKDFYLPQTRVRGYLVAIDAGRFGVGPATRIANDWKTSLSTTCRRPVSAPVSFFLRAPDDPATIHAKADMESKVPFNSEWGLSSLRHLDERRRHGLGRDDNPFSMKAMRNGRLIFASYPSHSWLPFWGLQGSRVVDSMDIVFASAKTHNIDLGYKTCVVDVSQNVDRTIKFPARNDKASTANLNLGIIGCITPSGMPIVTDLLRPVTGTEALALQGMPVDELVISTETQAQLRDLAGNAMTVTVVGAATLALLHCITQVAGAKEMLRPIEPTDSRQGLYLDARPLEWESLTTGVANTVATIDLQRLLAIVKNMVRMCCCPMQGEELWTCNACGTTACTACRGNPVHNFTPKIVRGPKESLQKGDVHLKELLPKSLKLPTPPSTTLSVLKSVKGQLYCNTVSEILNNDTIYYFDEIKVTEVVTVCYKAVNSIARLVLSAESMCCWYIYIAPWHSKRARFNPKFNFDQPIARGRLFEGATSFPEWSVWVPGRVELTLDLSKTSDGALVAANLTFAGGGDPEPGTSLWAWKETVEGRILGAYRHYEKCGTAGNALRIKQDSTTAAKVFLMWDSGRVRKPSEDHFVWTETMRRMEAHEYREILLHANPTIRWDIDSNLGSVDVFWPGHWFSLDGLYAQALGSQALIRDSGGQIRWGLTETLQQASCHAGGPPAHHMPVLAALAATIDRFPASLAQLYGMDPPQADGSFFSIPSTGRDPFLRTFAFLSSLVCLSYTPQNLAFFPHLAGSWVQVDACQDCSVAPPEISFYTKEVTRKNSGSAKYVNEIIEDPDEAAKFERQFQDLPRAVAVAARLLHNNTGPSTLDMRVMLQPKVLASRAFGYLAQAHRTASRGRLSLSSSAKTSFTVTLDYAPPSSSTGFTPFCDSLKPCGKEFTAGLDLDEPWRIGDKRPPRFGKHTLRKSQKDSVEWMMRRELQPLDFDKVEIEEEVVRPLNMRVVGKAEWANCFPYSSRGGVVAHEIGYGKTVIMLALHDYMREFDRTRSIEERREKVDAVWLQEMPLPFEQFGEAGTRYPALDAKSFSLHLDATLVVVPKHIIKQWSNETTKFLGLPESELTVISSAAAFYDYKLKSPRKPEIIILGSGVFTQLFVNKLQTIGGMLGGCPKGLSGRTLELWYRRALRNHRLLTAYYLAGKAAGLSHTELMRRLQKELLPALIVNQQVEIDALVKKQVPEINRKFYKGEASSVASASTQAKARPRVTPNITDKEWNMDWLHSFSFARIIWDECSYDENPIIPLFIENAIANSKWLLSGTPKLFGLEEVCRIASAFGIHVARPEPRMMPGLPLTTKGLELDTMSKSEQFHVFSSPVKSASLAHERHKQGHKFVAEYFRSNPLEQGLEVEFEEHVRPVGMTTVASARYFLLTQAVLDAGYDYTALPAHARAEVALRGVDLGNRDGREAAKMFLGLAACDLGNGVSSVGALVRHLSTQSDILSKQLKMLWDKMMWLRSWIEALKLDPRIYPTDPKFEFSQSTRDALNRVDFLCGGLKKSLDNMSFEDFGGRDMFQRFAAVIAGLPKSKQEESGYVDLDDDSFRVEWSAHFKDGWLERFDEEKALYTWLDFFDIRSNTINSLTPRQRELLSRQIFWLKYKFPQTATLFENGLPDKALIRHALDPKVSRSICRRSDRPNMLANLNDDDVRSLLATCISAKPEKDTWQQAKRSYKFAGLRGYNTKGPPRAVLQNRLRELNLRFNASHTSDQLKEMIWSHEQGLAVAESYRDGRAPPDKHRSFEVAIGCVAQNSRADKPRPSDRGKQIAASTEELKLTVVHLLKTVDDLKATWLEGKFVPEYSSLSDAADSEAVVKKKFCRKCGKALASTDSSFIVVACGHLLCDGCRFQDASYYCPVEHCTAFIRERPVLRCSQVCPIDGQVRHTKIDAIVNLIKHEIPREDFVVVFAQYGPLINALSEAFNAAKIRFVNLATCKDDPSEQLECFKQCKKGRVLLLDIDRDTSAGSNLTNASHVVFANPYVHKNKDHQARTVRQARGRCIRMGQTKKVHVYHFMVPDTIEEETLRELGKDSEDVKAFFDAYGRAPWWLDEERGEGKTAIASE
ncbi:DNA repair protein RAD5 [Madurella mycetomatis]|uniref:DNA repair protein RAD5 n=1 Tax=Madurella mycetomatis TaxID=100816 RepID=A0A175WB76_9PEZI|nr:DNA repair protein RAD5 [Madurella mycetomatis]